MKSYIVRAVDSGNIQRSPTFQAIFSYTFLKSTDLPFKIIFDSGGIDVDKILANSTPATKKLSIIDAGLYYNVIDGMNKSVASDLIKLWYGMSDEEIPEKEKMIITKVYSEVKTKVHTVQMNYRNAVLIEAGIPKNFLPDMRVPFRHETNLRLILPVEKSVTKKVEDYYKNLQAQAPMIRLYGDLVGVEPLKDELKGGIETARKQVNYFMDTRYEAMKEIVKLYKKE